MMKRILTALISVLLLISACSVGTFAAEEDWVEYEEVVVSLDDSYEYEEIEENHPTLSESVTVKFSADYRTIYFGKEKYSVFNDKFINDVDYYDLYNNIEYASGGTEIDNTDLDADRTGSIIYATIYYKDGTQFTAAYLKDKYRKEVENASNNRVSKYIIDFYWPEENRIIAEPQALFGSETNLYSWNVEAAVTFDVTTEISNKIIIDKGCLLIIDDEFYYIDYNEANLTYEDIANAYDEDRAYPARKITDEELIKKLSAAEDKYYTEDGGFLYDDDFTMSLGEVVIIFVFIVIPAAIFIAGIIFLIKSSKKYKKFFIFISAISLTEIILYFIIYMILQ